MNKNVIDVAFVDETGVKARSNSGVIVAQHSILAAVVFHKSGPELLLRQDWSEHQHNKLDLHGPIE